MLPDYLPILEIIGLTMDRGEASSLGGLLLEELAQCSIKVRLVEASIFDGSGHGGSYRNIVSHLVNCDLLLVNGPGAETRGQLQLGRGMEATSRGVRGRSYFSCPDSGSVHLCAKQLQSWLTECLSDAPIRGCVLIGGKSSRMGTPKHLIAHGGTSWIERSVSLFTEHLPDVVISGKGEVPKSLDAIERIKDLPGVVGPMAGIGALLKKYPFDSWIVAACDMPYITPTSMDWLAGQRKPGRSAVIPYNPVSARVEPLYGWYDFRSAPLFDRLIGKGVMKMSRLAQYPEVHTPEIPADLIHAWKNINSPEELDNDSLENL